MWTDEQAPPSGFGDASMEASPSPMRPTSGSASGPSPVDTPSPAKSAADEGFGMMHRPEPVEPSPQGPPPSGKQQFMTRWRTLGMRQRRTAPHSWHLILLTHNLGKRWRICSCSTEQLPPKRLATRYCIRGAVLNLNIQEFWEG